MLRTAKEVNGDLLTYPATYICHQCNCVTTNAAYLAKAVFTKFPYADIYCDRADGYPDEPGEIMICGNGKEQRYVVNMLSQYYPGKSKYNNDSAEKRLKWFTDCLEELTTLAENNESFAFPDRIGCGAAGGDWDKYKEKINQFASVIKGDVFIVKLP